MLKNTRSFDENIGTISSELELAVRWKRPSLLLAVCKSKLSQARAQLVLERLMQKAGQDIVRIGVNEKQPDVARSILQNGNVDRSVFFVSNLDQGGGEDGKSSYRILNIHRELFIERELRCVFWLTLNEAANLPKFAPDFWAFRHRVIEFASPHASAKTNLPAGVLTWHIRDRSDAARDLKEKIQSREALLRQLPDRSESMLAKAELWGELAYLYWRLGENDRARQCLANGIPLAEKGELSQIKAWLLNGLAILSYEKKEYREGFKIYSTVLQGKTRDGFLWMNLAVITSALGKNSEAAAYGRKALSLAPTDAQLWNTMGHLSIWMGKPDEATAFFKRAIELAPKNSIFHLALAACYRSLGLSDETRQEIVLARKYSENEETYLNVCQEAVLGKFETAFGLLKAALRNGQITRTDVERDPILNEVLDGLLTEI